MLSLLLALAVVTQTEAINTARQAYGACLRDYSRTSMDANMTPEAFETALGNQCQDRANAFTAALVERDRRAGGGRAAAEEDARMTMEDMRANVVERFRDEYGAAHPSPAAAPSTDPAPAPEPTSTPEPAPAPTPQ